MAKSPSFQKADLIAELQLLTGIFSDLSRFATVDKLKTARDNLAEVIAKDTEELKKLSNTA